MISLFLDQNMKGSYLENGKAAEAGSEVMPVGGQGGRGKPAGKKEIKKICSGSAFEAKREKEYYVEESGAHLEDRRPS